MINWLKNRISRPLLKLGAILAFAAIVLLLYVTEIGCAFRFITGIPCMGCGLTRAWLSALRLDFAAAFNYHQLFFLIPYLFLWLIFDCRLLPSKKLDYTVIALILAAFVVRWIIIMFFI